MADDNHPGETSFAAEIFLASEVQTG